MLKRRLFILATHPVQYQAHWFRALSALPELDLTVYFAQNPTGQDQGAAGFGVPFEWDIPLLSGYRSEFLRNIARRPSVNTFSGLNTPDIARIIRQSRPDAVMVLGWKDRSSWQAIRAGWVTRTPILARGDSQLSTARSMVKRALKRAVHGSFIPRFAACLAVGSRSEEYFRHYGARKVFRVPHTIDRALFARAAASSPRAELRSSLGLDPGKTTFLFAGKFLPRKRPLEFLRALELAAVRGGAVQGLMVGDGPLRAEVESWAQARGLPARFAGFVNQTGMAEIYTAADALVLPSDGRETWGLVVNEAMAAGLPCIVSDQVGCAPDLILPGETGDTFPLGEIDDLASLMVRYDTMRDTLMHMGESARQREIDFSDRPSLDGVLSALDAVTRGSGRGRR